VTESPSLRYRRAPAVAGWINAALGILTGFAATLGWLAGQLGVAESPFFILIACLLVAVGAFVLAGRPVPVAIFGLPLALIGVFLGFGLLVGGSALGAAGTGLTQTVGAAGLLLAALEIWSILAVWWGRSRPRMVQPGEPAGRDAGEEKSGGDVQS
jgi:hypothetical protein